MGGPTGPHSHDSGLRASTIGSPDTWMSSSIIVIESRITAPPAAPSAEARVCTAAAACSRRICPSSCTHISASGHICLSRLPARSIMLASSARVSSSPMSAAATAATISVSGTSAIS